MTFLESSGGDYDVKKYDALETNINFKIYFLFLTLFFVLVVEKN